MTPMHRMPQIHAKILWPALGFSYLLTFFTGNLLGLAASLYLLVNIHRRPSIYDVVPLFILIDIFSPYISSPFAIPLLSTIVFNVYFAKVGVFAFLHGRLRRGPAILLVLVLIASLWRGLATSDGFSSVAAFRDLKVILAIALALGIFRASVDRYFVVSRESIGHIAYFFIGVSAAICAYVAVFNTSIFYVVADSTKSIVGFSMFYAVMYMNAIAAAVVLSLTTIALVFMSTRMNFLLIFLLIAVLGLQRAPWVAVMAAVFAAIMLVFGLSSTADLPPQVDRIATVLNVFAEPSIPSLGPVLSRLAELDYIRAVEAHYTFQRATLAELVLGRGLGTGFQDTEAYISAAYIDRHAFSLEEFRSGTFFGLHDPIVEWTFRYGLIVSAALCAGLLLLLRRGVLTRGILPIVIFLLILSSYWSGKGVAIVGLLGFIYQFSIRQPAGARPLGGEGR